MQVTEKKTRIGFIDVMKGLCIIIVVLQHSDLLPGEVDGLFTRACKSFHMPMFFFVTGLFLPVGRKLPDMLTDRFNRLLLPWLVFAIVGGIIIDVCVRHNFVRLADVHAYAGWLVYGPNVPLYFLRALFISTVLAWLVARVCPTLVQRIGVMMILCALSWAAMMLSPRIGNMSYLPKMALDMVTVREVCGMLMYMWGGVLVTSMSALGRMKVSRRAGLAIFVAAVIVIALVDPPVMRWHYMEAQGPWLPITAAAVCGIAAIWGLSCLLDGFLPLRLAGEYSLVILVTHYIILYAMVYGFNLDKHMAGAITIVLLPAAVYAVRRWLPWACAARPLFSWRDGRLHINFPSSAEKKRRKTGA